jgi:hypothetical protein
MARHHGAQSRARMALETPMTKLSDKAREALKSAYATRGKHRGQLLARCPRSNTLEAAAWQAAMAVCNPYKMGIGTILFFNGAQKEIYGEVLAHFESLPHEHVVLAQRDREALERLGVW